jgi:anti-sigma factor RsiW
MIFDDPLLLVNAYLDGELDPASALGVEQRMAADPALAVEFARLEALRRLLREQLPRQAVPPVLPPASKYRPECTVRACNLIGVRSSHRSLIEIGSNARRLGHEHLRNSGGNHIARPSAR